MTMMMIKMTSKLKKKINQTIKNEQPFYCIPLRQCKVRGLGTRRTN